MHHLIAEAVASAPSITIGNSPSNALGHVAIARSAATSCSLQVLAHAQPISVKNTAKKASSTMTMKIAWTTAMRGPEADFLRIPLDLHALVAAGQRDDQAEHRRLDQADPDVVERDHFLDPLEEGQERNAQREVGDRTRRR